jgi:hypothetical protein
MKPILFLTRFGNFGKPLLSAGIGLRFLLFTSPPTALLAPLYLPPRFL